MSERVEPRAAAAAAPTREKRRRMRLAWLRYTLLALALLYGVYCVGVYKLQRRFIFGGAYSRSVEPDRKPPAGGQSVWLDMPDGARVEAWYFPATGVSAQRPGPALIFLHGSEKVLDDWWPAERPFTQHGISVLAPEYRGYGRSTGKPGQAEITADLVRMRAWLVARPEVDATRIVYHGRSLGGAVAAALAAEQPPAALILESTFSSLASFAPRIGVPEALCRHPYRTEDFLRTWTGPTLIFHGANDSLIPVAHGRRLHSATAHATYVETRDGHFDLPTDRSSYWTAITRFLEESGIVR